MWSFRRKIDENTGEHVRKSGEPSQVLRPWTVIYRNDFSGHTGQKLRTETGQKCHGDIWNIMKLMPLRPSWPSWPSCQGSAGGPVDLQAFLEAVSHTSHPFHFGYMQNGQNGWSLHCQGEAFLDILWYYMILYYVYIYMLYSISLYT